MTDYRVRLFDETDLGRLHEIDQVCFPADMAYSRAELRFYLRRPGAIVRVADRMGEVAGFVVGLVGDDGCGHVITLDVEPSARRQGIGRALMSALHEEFLCRNVRQAVLEVSVDNIEARRFYERIGYEYSGVLQGYYGGRTDAYRMVRRIDRASDLA